MTTDTTAIAQSNNFIVLDRYTRQPSNSGGFQSEDDLENEFVQDLMNQGYEFLDGVTTPDDLLHNLRDQLQGLNNVCFTDDEWGRFVEGYLNKAGEGQVEKTRKVHDDDIHDFVFDSGRIENIALFDKKNMARNRLQVIKQFKRTGEFENRYDVTILVNGLPLVQVELKKRGVRIREAFNQIHRYRDESFNSKHSIYKYLQIFVISNGTDSRYFANTTSRDRDSFDFTMNWAQVDNEPITDLKDFTATFFQKNTILNVLFRYAVFDANNSLLILRPYQIAAVERILWKIDGREKNNSKGGYIWHATGSGKTLTSFKAARLATERPFIGKVLFVVDRKDLDYQTMKEYQKFSPDSVNGSNNTAGLKRNLNRDDNKIIVTTLQKLHRLMKSERDLAVYHKRVIFIFDECHRSQFGEVQKKLKSTFKNFCQFGFTGTPIFDENASMEKTTQDVFGERLHSYLLPHAIRDDKVLKFKVDYNDTRPKFKDDECETDLEKLNAEDRKELFLHPERIGEISGYILKNFRRKTHRLRGNSGFNAMFAVNSIEAAKLYYEDLHKQQKDQKNKLNIATIFSFAANEETPDKRPKADGSLEDESFDPSALDSTAKQFLSAAIGDYNRLFGTSFGVESEKFQNYYRDLAKRVKAGEVDLLIVVGMFLTGFDAPRLNTLFVDKNLRHHGLIQAYSRTNRIYNKTKACGNIVTFRNLEDATKDAIRLFGDDNAGETERIILEKPFDDYIGEFSDLVRELGQRFSQPDKIVTTADKKAFVQLFGRYLRLDNKLQNYDEFACLKALQELDPNETETLEALQAEHGMSDDQFASLQDIPTLPSVRQFQDYCSVYHDIRDWLQREKESDESPVDWDDIVFEVDLLKSLDIDLDYILKQIFEHHQKTKDRAALVENAQRLIRASIGDRAKEPLLVDFINQADLDRDAPQMIDNFYRFAQDEQRREADDLIASENLNRDAAKRYLARAITQGVARDEGADLNEILPKMSPLNPQYLPKKQAVFRKVTAFVEKFKGIGEKA